MTCFPPVCYPTRAHSKGPMILEKNLQAMGQDEACLSSIISGACYCNRKLTNSVLAIYPVPLPSHPACLPSHLGCLPSHLSYLPSHLSLPALSPGSSCHATWPYHPSYLACLPYLDLPIIPPWPTCHHIWHATFHLQGGRGSLTS